MNETACHHSNNFICILFTTFFSVSLLTVLHLVPATSFGAIFSLFKFLSIALFSMIARLGVTLSADVYVPSVSVTRSSANAEKPARRKYHLEGGKVSATGWLPYRCIVCGGVKGISRP